VYSRADASRKPDLLATEKHNNSPDQAQQCPGLKRPAKKKNSNKNGRPDQPIWARSAPAEKIIEAKRSGVA
jgi:hypothetical protein